MRGKARSGKENKMARKVFRCPACGEVSTVPSCPGCGVELLTVIDSDAARRDQDQTSADADQTASDQDQTWSDHDQTASASDQRTADEDQHAADDFFFSSRRRHTRSYGDWSSDVCSSD